jgi:LacI family gluconate utilization system Gnt-I transcriptional repressor
MARLLALKKRPRAVFCSADAIAVGALFECQRQGVSIPGEVAIAGFDDVDLAGQVVPALTTIRVLRYELGRRAGLLIGQRLAGETVASAVVDVGFEFVARDSA